MPNVTFDEKMCKGCGLCVTACPKKIVHLSDDLNKRGYHPAEVTEQDKSIACAY